jgi:hypothetical protein
MNDLTPLLNLLALHMLRRHEARQREARNIGDYDAYLAVQHLTDRIHYLTSFIHTLTKS